MDEATIALTVTSLAIFLIFVGFLIWGVKTDQFKNVEEPKYSMLENGEVEKTKEK